MDKKANLDQMIEEQVHANADKLTDEQKQAMKEALTQVMKEGKLPYEAMNFDADFLEYIYGNGYQLFKSGHFDKAKEIFQLLMMLNPSDPKYCMGLATCARQQKDFDGSIQYFFQTALLDRDNPYPFYFAAECFVEKKDYASGIFALKLAEERVKNNPKLAPLSKQIAALVENLESKVEEKPKEESLFKDLDPETRKEVVGIFLNNIFPVE
ncbi:MAG: SycD/LcrH family type III secretion system chaperone [Waddliaceae bacterium]